MCGIFWQSAALLLTQAPSTAGSSNLARKSRNALSLGDLWRAVDQNGKVIDFRLTARRDAKAARAFFRQARETARIYGPMSITTDKAPAYKRILAEMNEFGFPGEEIIHVDKKCQNNRIESDHAALKRLTDPGKGFQSLRTAKATLKGIEAVRMIKRGHVYDPPNGVLGEVRLLNEMFGLAA